jgi:hypothetical protein
LTPEQVQQLVTEYEVSVCVKNLAARWGVHRTTIAAQLKQARHPAPQARRVRPSSRGCPAVRRGWSCQGLAERDDCNATTVWKLLQQAGVRLRVPWEQYRSHCCPGYRAALHVGH